MRDTHGVFKNYFDSYRVRWEGIDTHGGSMPWMEGVEIVAPEVTSFTVSRTWLEHVRETFREAGDEVQVQFLDGMIGTPKPPRVLPIEVVADAWTDNWGGDRRGETAMHLASVVVAALRDAGYRIVEASDGD